MIQNKTVAPIELARSVIDLSKDKKSEDISLIDVGEVSNITEYLVLCCGNNSIHIKTIAKWLKFKLKEKYGIYPLSVDGSYPSSDWIVLDLNSVIVHIMSKDVRYRYKMEDFWNEIKNSICN